MGLAPSTSSLVSSSSMLDVALTPMVSRPQNRPQAATMPDLPPTTAFCSSCLPVDTNGARGADTSCFIRWPAEYPQRPSGRRAPPVVAMVAPNQREKPVRPESYLYDANTADSGALDFSSPTLSSTSAAPFGVSVAPRPQSLLYPAGVGHHFRDESPPSLLGSLIAQAPPAATLPLPLTLPATIQPSPELSSHFIAAPLTLSATTSSGPTGVCAMAKCSSLEHPVATRLPTKADCQPFDGLHCSSGPSLSAPPIHGMLDSVFFTCFNHSERETSGNLFRMWSAQNISSSRQRMGLSLLPIAPLF
ncbi:unnamed protein product [Protopolystoma xenopodis]|uniref:Uncharacterized protein n=1 Tax=Protopolystoma xenopodis TaxID=117903 RepID=A0A3S5AT82_9PLAT|nr:unnamed protein product [Protopolystoma xenopodis]